MTSPDDQDVIRLDDLLKLSGIAGSGGQAKAMVQGGGVLVNGEVDIRRGRKLRVGDRVEASGRTIVVDAALLRRSPDEDAGGATETHRAAKAEKVATPARPARPARSAGPARGARPGRPKRTK